MSVFLTTRRCILSVEVTKPHSFIWRKSSCRPRFLYISRT